MLPPTELSDVAQAVASAILDVRYATPDNFTGKRLYVRQLAWLRHEPLEKLVAAAEEFADDDYRIVIFDAYRPVSVQKKLRAVCDDSNYVESVSNHCRGITIDMTLAYPNGVYLDMGSDYDDFSEVSHPESPLVTNEQRANRKFLAEVMQKYGFVQHPREWWHFDYQPDRQWGLIEDELNAYEPEPA
jgi:D-alanyl-D-alanine dipeptidase